MILVYVGITDRERKFTGIVPGTTTSAPESVRTAAASDSGWQVSSTAVASARRRRARQRNATQGPATGPVKSQMAVLAAMAAGLTVMNLPEDVRRLRETVSEVAGRGPGLLVSIS